MRLHEPTHGALLLGFLMLPLAPLGLAQERPDRPARPEGEQEAQKRGVQLTTQVADQGVTLFTPLRSKTTYLVGPGGETLHTWPSEYQPGNSVYLLEDGSVLRTAKDGGDAPFNGGGEGGRIQRISWDGELIWDYPMASNDWRQHHDIEPLPNGNVLAIVWEGATHREALLAGRDAEHTSEKNGLWPDAVVELQPDGLHGAKVVWEWHSFDHLVQDRNERLANFGKPSEMPHRIDVNFDVPERPKTEEERNEDAEVEEHLRGLGYSGGDDDDEEGAREPRSDWMHTNSIDYHPGLDLVAISVRESSEVWLIDHSTTTAEAKTGEGGRYGRGGDLVYRFGRPAAYGKDGPRQLYSQHDARFVHGADGIRMTVFNNGGDRPGGDRSSVDEYALPFSADKGFEVAGGMPQPAVLAWSYNGGETTLYNGHICGAQRLASGNTLMCLGEEGRTIEVNQDGEIVWDWLQEVRAEAGTEGGRRGGRNRPERPGGQDGAEGPERPDGPGGQGPPRDGPGGDGPPPGGRRGPPGDGPRGRGRGGPGGGQGAGRGPRSEFAIFRVTRYPANHPGVSRLEETEKR